MSGRESWSCGYERMSLHPVTFVFQIIFCYFHYQWLMYYFNLTLPIFQMTLLMIILRPISKEYAIISIDFALDIKKIISRNGILKGNLYLSGFGKCLVEGGLAVGCCFLGM